MKKILSIALIALVAVTTVMASPVFSGRFGVKYTYTYDTGVIAAGNRNYMLLTDSNGIWTLDFQSAGFDYTTFKGYASINVAEGLKAIDVELPISLAVSIGTTGQYADYVYSDPNSKVSDDYNLGLATSADAPIAITGGFNGWNATIAAGIETDKQAIGFDVKGTFIDGIDVVADYTTEGMKNERGKKLLHN